MAGHQYSKRHLRWQHVDFLVANDGSNYALSDVGGPGAGFNISKFFDQGMLFFYGRTVYFAIDGKSAGRAAGPYYA